MEHRRRHEHDCNAFGHDTPRSEPRDVGMEIESHETELPSQRDTYKPVFEAECTSCHLDFEIPAPSWVNLVRWRCTECGGRLELHVTCEACDHVNDVTTGWWATYTTFASPGTCDYCGESMGLRPIPAELVGSNHLAHDLPHFGLVLHLPFYYGLFAMITFGFAGCPLALLVAVLDTEQSGGSSIVSRVLSGLALLTLPLGWWWGTRRIEQIANEGTPRPLEE